MTDLSISSIDLRALARQDGPSAFNLPLSAFPRVVEDLPDPLPHGLPALDDMPVTASWRAEWRQALSTPLTHKAGGVAPEQLWLHLEVRAQLPQTCQRCLGVYAQQVEVDRWFRFVADEATAEAEDDDCEEDLLVMAPRFDLLRLIEDELLMGLPLVPMHETCPGPVRLSAGEGDLSQEAGGKPHPFAGLAALRTGRGGQGK
jgi:uncharacterized protein